ncbi:alpha/beta fold hydrolase [Pseudolysinimonas sp.]|uniref:alpha/beta fold hydrolase n=1 Tax=Pseudolysinimonas sp. TaxID=2680009 RepID=UPI0037840D98
MTLRQAQDGGVPTIRLVPLSTGGSGIPFLLGPSLGTRVARVWDPVLPLLGDHPLYGWDLPGHGVSPATTSGFSIEELADGILAAADDAGLARFAAAGVSLGGVGSLAVALRAPSRVARVTMVCSLPKIGTAEAWAQRASDVRASGTPSLVQGSASRWFAPGFIAASPTVSSPLLTDLMDVDDESYALCVEALAATDLRPAVSTLAMPFTIIAGAEDEAIIPLPAAEDAVASARSGTLHVIPNAAHLATVEKPAEVAAILLSEAS